MPTGKAIAHWIGCINAIKRLFLRILFIEDFNLSGWSHIVVVLPGLKR